MLNLFFFFLQINFGCKLSFHDLWLQIIKYKIAYRVQKDVDGHITRSKFSDIKSSTLQD
jgi:hypothetical protein